MLADTVAANAAPLTEDEKAAVAGQLERLLASPHFSHSKRFPAFLRYVIEHTLAGEEDELKERRLGMDIFHRPADYDTATDPIVRVTAAEIRKRIAQYYQEPGRERELRISLPAGSYVPHFLLHSETGEIPQIESRIAEELNLESVRVSARLRRKHLLLWVAAAIALLFVAGSAGYWYWHSQQASPLEAFWGPVLAGNDPVLICVADQQQYASIALRDAADLSKQTILPDKLTAIVIDDLSPIVKVAEILEDHGKRYSMGGEATTNLTDLRNGPTIFIGAFDNEWTLRLTKSLRYHFGNNADMTQFRIVDSNEPGSYRWVVDRSQQLATNNYRDYSLIARFTDPTTGKLAVVMAGIGRGGTIAAGEFLTDPASLRSLTRISQDATDKKNVEVVLSAPIIGGEPGSPRIEATYFW